jgi:hypothetical protein
MATRDQVRKWKETHRLKPKMLRDYQWVYEHPLATEGEVVTPVRTMLRGQLLKDAGKFLAMMQRMEEEHRVAVGKNRAARLERERETRTVNRVDDDGGLDLVEEWINERENRAGA